MKVCFTGGGTAGHLFPAFQVDSELRRRASGKEEPYTRFWIGTTSLQERTWVIQAGMPFYPVSTGKFRRYLSLRNITDIFGLLIGFFQSLTILHREKPDILFSKGGFASVPTVVAAWLLGIPSVTHESDAIPGLATRINARFVQKVCLPFSEASGVLKNRYHAKLVVTGTPVRFSRSEASGQRARSRLGIDGETPLLVVLGGSQGALQINQLVWNNLEALTQEAYVFHQMGHKTFQEKTHGRYRGVAFLDEGLADLLDAATVVVSRAGATAIGELLEMEKPMVLVPLGTSASRGDQLLNAERLRQKGAAVVLAGEVSDGLFVDAVVSLLRDTARRQYLQEKCASLHTCSAERAIVDVLLDVRK